MDIMPLVLVALCVLGGVMFAVVRPQCPIHGDKVCAVRTRHCPPRRNP